MLIPQRENSNAIFASDKLQNSNNLVNAVAIFDNITINDVVYELNAATVSDSQVEFARDSNGINHTNNRINHQNLLSSRMIRIWHKKVTVFASTGKHNYWRYCIGTTGAQVACDARTFHGRGFKQNNGKQDSADN